MQDTRSWFEGSIVLAGGITSGRQIAAARLLGAEMVSIGTRFIATREANASEPYKAMIVVATAEEAIYTDEMSGIPANVLGPPLREWSLYPQSARAGTVDAATWAVHQGTREGRVWRDIWSAGQGVGGIDDVPKAATLCRQLATEYRDAVTLLPGFLRA